MSVSVGTLRARIRAAVEAVADFREWPSPPEMYPRATERWGHKAFAVRVLGSDVQSPADGGQRRRRVGDEGRQRTRVQVVWTYRLREDNAPDDYDAALDTEAPVRAAVLGVSQLGGLTVTYTACSRSTSGDGTFLQIVQDFTCHHMISLE